MTTRVIDGRQFVIVGGKPLDLELLRAYGQIAQRTVLIGGLLWFVIGHPDHTTAWALLGAVVADLFHTARANGKNGAG